MTPVVRALLWVVAGGALLALYYVLALLEVGGIGAPSDIGGGLIPLTGCILLFVGLLKLVFSLKRGSR
jgi:hypothetical protein